MGWPCVESAALTPGHSGGGGRGDVPGEPSGSGTLPCRSEELSSPTNSPVVGPTALHRGPEAQAGWALSPPYR